MSYIDQLHLNRAKNLLIEKAGGIDNLKKLSPEKQQELIQLQDDLALDMQNNVIKYYRPFAWQKNFWEMGKYCSRRAAIAGNRTGKTQATTFELACHLSGVYPAWWEGKRFDRAINGIAMGDTWDEICRTVQFALLGTVDISQKGMLGTGFIPKHTIIEKSIRTDGSACKSIAIKHITGKNSQLWFGAYTQDRTSMQGFTLDVFLGDEQLPDDVNSEMVTRLATTGGHAIYSFTPLLGVSGIVARFEEGETGYKFIRVGWDDLPEYNPWGEPFFLQKDRDQLARDFMPHERDARIRGFPLAGVGAIFPLLELPTYFTHEVLPMTKADWERIIALDLGLVNDPTVITFGFRDPYTDAIYIHKQIILKNTKVEDYLQYLTHEDSAGIPIILPADANRLGIYTLDESSVRQTLEAHGLEVMPTIMNPPDENGDTNNRKDYGLTQMRIRMETNPPTLYINVECQELLRDMRNYYVDEKMRYKGKDDTIDSARYCVLGFLNGYGTCKNYTKRLRIKREQFRQKHALYQKPPKSFIKDLYKPN